MQRYRYTTATLFGDYVRAGIGLISTLGPCLFVDLASVMFYLLACLAVLFALFLTRTVIRHASSIERDETGISQNGPIRRAIPWSEITGLEIRYFSTKRDRSGGWMQMKIKGPGQAIAVDSGLDGFTEIATAAAHAADTAGLVLNDATRANLLSLGVADTADGAAT